MTYEHHGEAGVENDPSVPLISCGSDKALIRVTRRSAGSIKRRNQLTTFRERKVLRGLCHGRQARVALKRLQNPYRLQLPKLRALDLILENDAWIVVDRSLNDIPVVAWLDFKTRDRALHDPVPCRLNLYHSHALIIAGEVLEAMALLIGEALAEHAPEVTAGVTPLRNR